MFCFVFARGGLVSELLGVFVLCLRFGIWVVEAVCVCVCVCFIFVCLGGGGWVPQRSEPQRYSLFSGFGSSLTPFLTLEPETL